MDDDHWEIEVVQYRKDAAPLRQSIHCDSEMAVAWLMTVAQEISSTAPSDDDPPWKQLGEGGKVWISPSLRVKPFRHPDE